MKTEELGEAQWYSIMADHNQLFWPTSRYNYWEPGPLIAKFSSKIKGVEGKKERKKITWVPRLKDLRNTQLSPWWNLSQPHACLPNVRNNINIILLDGRVLI